MGMLTTARTTDAAPGAHLHGLDVDDTDWLETTVPGDLHQALEAAGRLPALNHGLDDTACAWMEEREWWYRLRFTAPEVAEGERLRLVLHGVDTFATYWLDGAEVGRSANMFRPVHLDVTTSGEHLLAVCFHRPLDIATQDDPLVGMRKSAYSYGWDFAPRRPTVGLWKPVELVREKAAAIGAVQFQTLSLDGAARVDVEVDAFTGSPVEKAIRLLADGQVVATGEDLSIAEPRLWWTHDRGEPFLYDLEVDLLVDGEVVASDRRKVGLRTVELDESPDPDEPGSTFFRFVLNGVPLPVKGVNWVPADTAVATVPADRYVRHLHAARDAHMNMVRVWGGGIYEHDVFYDTCDELGLLVWQDFMFGNSPYQDSDPELMAEIDAEARHQLKRLRTRACLALWCGNNEVELLAEVLRPGQPYPAPGIFDELLPRAVQDEDAKTPYLSTSPCQLNSMQHGDRHAWKVWHGLEISDEPNSPVALATDGLPVEPGSEAAAEFVRHARPELYLTDTGRFISEYGLASASSYETLLQWTDSAELQLDSPQVRNRLRGGKIGPTNKFDLILAATTGTPKDLLDFCDLSQLMQAEGVKLGAEHYRRRWPHCGGQLIWQLNDCWPSISWAMIDFDERPKPVLAYARRFFAPVLASFAPTADGVALWVSNDSAEPVREPLVVQVKAFDGTVRWEQSVEADVPAGGSQPVAEWALDAAPDAYVSVRSASGLRNRHLFVPVKDLVRDVRVPAFTVEGEAITVQATAFAFAVSLVHPDPLVRFSDNHFDLEAGESRTVTASTTDLAGLVVRSR